MTAAVGPLVTASAPATPDRARALRRAVAVGIGLVAAVALRWWATDAAVAGGVEIGLVFGAILLLVAALDVQRGGRPGGGPGSGLASRPGGAEAAGAATWRRDRLAAFRPSRLALGIAGGLALVALALLARMLGGIGDVPSLAELGGGVSFTGWALATIVVSGGEEAILRGSLFRRITELGGTWWAVAVTSLAFALMHVPFYGWHVVPLDLGVGIWLAGLRLESGGLVAPWLAHAIADLATWWL